MGSPKTRVTPSHEEKGGEDAASPGTRKAARELVDVGPLSPSSSEAGLRRRHVDGADRACSLRRRGPSRCLGGLVGGP